MKKKNLLGQHFNQLTVIAPAPDEVSKSGNKRTMWICQCDCGKVINVQAGHLTRKNNPQQSCGCHILQYGTKYKPGDKVGRLTTISYDNGFWKCECICGNRVEIITSKLVSGNTQSCGCLRDALSTNRIHKIIENNRQFEPRITSARRVWKTYVYNDQQNGIICALTFEDFFKLSQECCYYCGIEPSQRTNMFINKKNASEKSKNEGWFIYNGIDRKNSNLSHMIDNCVSCCWTCNRAKLDKSTTQFLDDVMRITLNVKIQDVQQMYLPDNKYVIQSIKSVYRRYSTWKDPLSDISIEQFYYLSQQNCFYCDGGPSNKINAPLTDKKSSAMAKAEGWFVYNGLDRIDSTKSHTIDNVVSCCKTCNLMKNNLSLDAFLVWAKRLQAFQSAKHT
jgi:hypothetical protein